MTTTIRPLDPDVLEHVVNGSHGDPHSVLGAHSHAGKTTVRVLRPLADSVAVIHGGKRVPLEHEHGGIWAGVLDVPQPPDYRLEVTILHPDGSVIAKGAEPLTVR